MKIQRKFTTAGSDPFASVKWVKRSSKITNPDGSVVFRMDDAEVPETWSQLATDIMVSKYFRKAGVPQIDEGGERVLDANGAPVLGPEKSARQVIHRLAGCWRHWGEKHNYFDTPNDAQAFYDELAHMLVHQMAAPNSPQWFNTGLNWAYGITGPAQGHFVPDPYTGKVTQAADAYTHPQPHACFIQSVEDDLVNEGGIMDLWVREARLFKYGSGTGTNFSRLRAENENLSGGGKSSGLMSWLKIGDRAAAAIKSGGTTRRAAKMVCLDMDHPDIGSFINWKVREEIKVQAMVEGMKAIADRKAGAADTQTIGQTADRLGLKLDYDFNGEAYQTVSGQNSNNSVRIPDEFFAALAADGEWRTRYRTSDRPARTFKARDLWDQIGYAAWRCADPGVQFDGTINAWHTCPAEGRINASNPCVTGDTLVATTTGCRRIKDLVGKTVEVINGRGEKAWVDRVFKTGHKPVFELKTASGYTLTLTADHPVHTLGRGDVPACELTVDDVVELRGAGFGDEFVPEEFGELLGAAVGDGCVTHQAEQDHLFVALSRDEAAVADHLRANIDHCKHWLSTGDARKTRPSGVTVTQTGLRVQTSVRAIVDRMCGLAVLDAGSENKSFTDAFFALDRRSIAAVLRGLFTADGTVANYGSKSQYVALDSTSLGLLRQVQLALLSFGVKAKIYENRRALFRSSAVLPDGRGGQQSYPARQVHSLRVTRSSRVVFEREIGFIPCSVKARQLGELNAGVSAYADRMIDRVASLEPRGEADVFDLTEPASHHFVANGLVVHNCSEYMFLDNTACNLASINVLKFYDAATRVFDTDRYEHAIDLWTIVLEVSVLMASYPSSEVARLSWKYRTLGLGYANLGAMLMQAGIPYDSDEARAVCACLTSILTGRAYRQSAVMAAQLGSFDGYAENRDNMLRVVRNHRLAAHGVPHDAANFEGLTIPPVPIDHGVINAGRVPLVNADDLLDHSTRAWDEALQAGEKFGYRNAQVTVIAPTGTIGLLMDCDTTGIEPDFALVKFKKLAGGGYFKIANESVRPALAAMGYSPAQIGDILRYLLGTLSADAPMPAGSGHRGTFREFLSAKGLNGDDVRRLNDALPGVFELSFAFNAWTLGDGAVRRLGLDPDAVKANPGFNMLAHLGLDRATVAALNEAVCGTQTIEGAPHLQPEHLGVFDCANKCGKKGVRFIAAQGHIRMMAAAQPFISGAISKTINLPSDASVQDIKDCYMLSWELGLKANALYRDGCKLSQPLSATADAEKSDEAEVRKQEDAAKKGANAAPAKAEAASPAAATPAPVLIEAKAPAQPVPESEPRQVTVEKVVERVVERPMRRRLTDTRASITHKFSIAGHEGYLTVGLYDDGMPGELFITMAKEGSTIGGLMDSLGTAVSVALQYGVPIESLVNKFTHQRFEPAGMTTNRDIPIAKSLVDYIFRWMGMEFIPGYREANAPRRGRTAANAAEAIDDDNAAHVGAGRLKIANETRTRAPGGDPARRNVTEDSPSWNDTAPLSDPDPHARATMPAPGESDVTEVTAQIVTAAPLPTVKSELAVESHRHVHEEMVVSSASSVKTVVRDRSTHVVSRAAAGVSGLNAAMRNSQEDAPACDGCGTITVRSGTCYKCLNCGASMGCS